MTAKGIYEAVLTELNKLLAPSITLEDFNYFFNKGISLYINKRYNIYDVNQLTTDDLRVLKSTTILTPKKATAYIDSNTKNDTSDDNDILESLYGATYEVNLPDDYLHILNCICVYEVTNQYKCYDAGNIILRGASRLVADAWGQVMNNFYMKPSYNRPYYYIHNVNTKTEVSTNPIVLDDYGQISSGTDYSKLNSAPSPTTTDVCYYQISTSYEKPQNARDVVLSDDTVKDMSTFNNDQLALDLNSVYYFTLFIPENWGFNGMTIKESNVGDATYLYTNRNIEDQWVTVSLTDSNNNKITKNYLRVTLGTGHNFSGNYTITFMRNTNASSVHENGGGS